MQNPCMIQFFHWYYPADGHLWKHVIEEADHLSHLGISAVWLPPACKAAEKGSVGYDIYDLYDLGEFDQKGSVATKYGTKEELIQAIKTLHDKGIKSYADVILNHKAGADEAEEVKAFKVDPEDRTKRISDIYKIKAFTKFTFPGRGDKYSSFKWDYQCFTGVDWDDDKKEKGVYKILNSYGFSKKWEKVLGGEKGNFDYLMFADIEFRNKAVRKELTDWGLWFLEATGIDGFRLDAVKHISVRFFPKWLKTLRKTTQKEVFTVGEHASTIDLLLKYLDATEGCMSLFDFPLHRKFNAASKEGKEFDLQKIFEGTLVNEAPDHCVTFVDNHDTQAFRQFESPIENWFRPLAYALILLREDGYPCIFFPDLYGSHYTEKDKAGNDVEVKVEIVHELEPLLKARKEYAYGKQKDYFDHSNVIGWIREGIEEKTSSGCAVLISNGDDGKKEMEVGKHHGGRTFKDMTGNHEEKITIDNEGKGVFKVNAGSVSVWVRE